MNPDAVPKVEVVAQSFIPEAAVATTGLSPDQEAQRRDAQELRRIFEESKAEDPYAALKRREKKADLTDLDLEEQIKRRIEEDPSATADLRAGMLEAATVARIIVEKGIDGITDPADQEAILKEYVRAVIDTREAFSSLTDDEKLAVAREQLSSPEVRVKIAETVRAKLDPSVDVEDATSGELATKRGGKAARDKEIADSQAEIEKIQLKLAELRGRLASMQRAGEGGRRIDGLVYREMVALNQDINMTRLTELRRELDALYTTNQTINRAQYDADKEATLRQKQLGLSPTDPTQQKFRELIDIEEKQTRLAELMAGKETLPGQITAQEQELKTQLQAKQAARESATKLEGEIDPLVVKKRLKERELVLDMKGVIYETGNQALDDAVGERVAFIRGQITEKAAATTSADEKMFYDVLNKRWEKVETQDASGHLIPPHLVRDQDRVNADWQRLADEKNSLGLVEDLLTAPLIDKVTNAGTLGLSADEVTGLNNEIERIKKKLKEDKTFAEKVTSDFIVALLSRKMEYGGGLTKEELQILDQLGWKEHLNEAFNAKLTRDKGLQARAEELFEKVGISDKPSLETIRAYYFDKIGELIALLLSGASLETILKKIPQPPKPPTTRGKISEFLRLS